MKDIGHFRDQIRVLTCETLIHAKGGHFGGCMSIVETLAVLYGKHIKYDADNPGWEDRDWFVLSKGHCGPAYYSTLSLCGFFDKGLLYTLNGDRTKLPSHPDCLKTPGVDCTTGSLGQGISQAVGVAYALKQKKKNSRVYCIVGDGECNEGQVWEAIQFAVGHHLDNMIIFIDDNKKQLDGRTADVNIEMQFENIASAFGCYVQKADGSDLESIDQAVQNAQKSQMAPSVIVLETVKGQGISCIEGMENNHHITITDGLKKAIEAELKDLEVEI